MDKKVWSKEEIKELIRTNDRMVVRCLRIMDSLQTEDEKQDGDAKHLNGKGYNGIDAKICTDIYNFYKKTGGLTVKQLEIVRKKLLKYSGQLMTIANA